MIPQIMPKGPVWVQLPDTKLESLGKDRVVVKSVWSGLYNTLKSQLWKPWAWTWSKALTSQGLRYPG